MHLGNDPRQLDGSKPEALLLPSPTIPIVRGTLIRCLPSPLPIPSSTLLTLRVATSVWQPITNAAFPDTDLTVEMSVRQPCSNANFPDTDLNPLTHGLGLV